jgi:hypothetical protein
VQFIQDLRVNRTLKQLLRLCLLGVSLEMMAFVCFVDDALSGNTTMELLNISFIEMGRNALDDITRMMESMPRLYTIYMAGTRWAASCEISFVMKKSQYYSKQSQVYKSCQRFVNYIPINIRAVTCASITSSLVHNQQLNRVASLLWIPPPPPRRHRPQHATSSSLMLKISHMAITKFAQLGNGNNNSNNNNNACRASAIFKLFTARPQLLAKHSRCLQRPPIAAALDGTMAALLVAAVS